MDETATVLWGVGAFIFGQVIIRFVLDPIQEQRKIIGEVIYAQILFDSALPSLQDVENEEQHQTLISAKKQFRELTGKLLATTNTIPFYLLWSILLLVPYRAHVIEAAKLLLDVAEELGNAHDGNQTRSLSDKRFRILKLLKVKYWKTQDQEK